MSTTQHPSPNGVSGTTAQASVPPSRDIAAMPLALFLWVVVLAALAYGVVQTLTKVVALFS